MINISKIRSLMFAAMLAMLASANAHATHFRSASVSWTLVSGNTVEITIRESWDALFGNTWTLGDGGFYTATAANLVGSFTDSSGEIYGVYESTFQHTYPGPGPYTIELYNCCRISTLNNDADGYYRVAATVDLNNGQQGSPKVSLPAILQMDQGVNLVSLAVVDPDGPVTCRLATSAESQLFTVPTVGSGTLSVTSDCNVQWDASLAAIGSKWAVQVIVEEGGSQVPFDLNIEILDLADAPSCILNGVQSNTIEVGVPFSISVTATDPLNDDLTVNALGMPIGATLTPSSGSTGSSPLTATFDWTPSTVGTEAVTLAFANSSNATCQSSFSLEVEESQDGVDPTITITTPPDGASYLLNESINADYACEDEAGGSGVASCDGTVADGTPIDTATVGGKTFTVDAADNAGNTSSLTHNYGVGYLFTGFFTPVDNLPTRNVAKAGQAIPLKWRVTDANGVPVTTLTNVSVTASNLVCLIGPTPDQVEEYASGSSGLQNLGDGYYQFNWKTPKSYAGSCKTVKVNVGDNVVHTAEFKFTR